jgi:hypothetical protein
VSKLTDFFKKPIPQPEICPPSDKYNCEILVSIHADDMDKHKDVLRFTTDGSKPHNISPIYYKPFIVSDDTVVKAAVFRKHERGPIAKAVYAFPNAYCKPKACDSPVIIFWDEKE